MHATFHRNRAKVEPPQIGESDNDTAAAQRRNAENVTFTESPEIARQFIVNWDSRLQVSRTFDGFSVGQ